MGDHTDYYVDPALEKMFHEDLAHLNLDDNNTDSDDVIGAHLPEWLIGVIIVIVMLIVAFFVMVITSLIKKRKKNQSSLNGDALSPGVSCDDLESGKIGQDTIPKPTSNGLSCDLKNVEEDNSCPPEKDFTSTSHKALLEVSNSNHAGSSCRNPLFVDDDEGNVDDDNDQRLDHDAVPQGEVLPKTEVNDVSESARPNGSANKHKTCKVSPITVDNRNSSSCFNSPTIASKLTENRKKTEAHNALSHETKTIPDRTSPTYLAANDMLSHETNPIPDRTSPTYRAANDTLSEHDDVFDGSNNDESCNSISSCSDVSGEEKDKNLASFRKSPTLQHPTDVIHSSPKNKALLNSNDTDSALDSLENLRAVCNGYDDDGEIEQDTGIISSTNSDRPDLLQRSPSNASDGKLWLGTNGQSLQDLVTSHLAKSMANSENAETNKDTSDEVTFETYSLSETNGHQIATNIDYSSHEGHDHEDMCDRLSTNL